MSISISPFSKAAMIDPDQPSSLPSSQPSLLFASYCCGQGRLAQSPPIQKASLSEDEEDLSPPLEGVVEGVFDGIFDFEP